MLLPRAPALPSQPAARLPASPPARRLLRCWWAPCARTPHVTPPAAAPPPPCTTAPCLPSPPWPTQLEGQAECGGHVPGPVGLGQPEPGGLPDRRVRGGAEDCQGEGPALRAGPRALDMPPPSLAASTSRQPTACAPCIWAVPLLLPPLSCCRCCSPVAAVQLCSFLIGLFPYNAPFAAVSLQAVLGMVKRQGSGWTLNAACCTAAL